MYAYNILLFLLPILAILSEILSSVEIYSEIKLNFVEIQISKRKSIRIFLLSHVFLLLSLHEFHLEIAGNGHSRLRKSKFSRGACPQTPLAYTSLRA
jgi:hypothetical protein